MPGDVDLFVLYRWFLATVCLIYAMVRLGYSLGQWLSYFGRSRRTTVLGHYVGVMLLRVRMKRYVWDLCQIGLLLAVLGYIIYAHSWFDGLT
jgi:hypothetical protein